jgi:tetratricopeptide (TPR) repeat protein
MSNPFLPNAFMLLNTLLSNSPIEYDESMTAEKLTDIAIQNMICQDYDNMKICFMMAIEKNYTPAMLQFARYYEQFEMNINEMIRLYELAIQHNDKNGAIALSDHYKSKNDIPNTLKYLNICVDKFNDIESINDLIAYYNSQNDEVNSLNYCDKLITLDQSNGYYMKGKTYQTFKKYSDMKIWYEQFLHSIDVSTIVFNTKNLTQLEKQFAHVIKLYMDNDINIPLLQFILHKLNITNSSILGHIQFKLNKTKLKDPVYNKIGSCNICFSDDVQLQLFDCLGHYYCQDCTISMDKCAICRCSKKCSHI